MLGQAAARGLDVAGRADRVRGRFEHAEAFRDAYAAYVRPTDGLDWWHELTAAGGEGMVVKPAHLTTSRVQAGATVRGREYLRIVYSPDCTDAPDVLRERHLEERRQLALREHALDVGRR